MKAFSNAFVVVCLCVVVNANADWFDSFYPCRLELKLAQPTSGSTCIDYNLDEVIAALDSVCLEEVSLDLFAFEKAVLVDPTAGKAVGGFKLIAGNDNLIENSDYSTWDGFDPATMEVKDGILHIRKSALSEGKISYPLALEPGMFYLLEYRVYNDLRVKYMKPQIEHTTASYVKKLHPQKQWADVKQLAVPHQADSAFSIDVHFTGECRITDIWLRKAAWKLIAEPDNSVDELHLYYVPRAGSSLTAPSDEVVADAKDVPAVAISDMRAQYNNSNADGFYKGGKYVEVWTIPSAYPLRFDKINLTKPDAAAGSNRAGITLFRGDEETLIVAIESGTPYLQIKAASQNLPVAIEFKRMAPIPVFDGPHPRGKKYQTRYEALMDLDDKLMPGNYSGVHLVAITYKADECTPAGTYNDTITLSLSTQVPDSETFKLPVTVKVLPVFAKKLNHFKTSFSGAHMTVRYDKGGVFTKDAITPAEFHGLRVPSSEFKVAFDTIWWDKVSPEVWPLRDLAWKYYHKMLDCGLLPETVGIWAGYTYDIKQRGEGKAPRLINWNFDDFDKAVDEFLVKRDIPYFTLYRTNGHVIHQIRLSDGKVYGFKEERICWPERPFVLVEEDEFYELAADYFDAIAKHLYKGGFKDRMLYVIDECDATTFETVYKYWKAFQKKKYARYIKFGHTGFVTSIFTYTLPDGTKPMDEVLDLPMILNDEGWNFLEPEYNARQKHTEEQWVYYMKTDHLNLENAGLNTVITPLKLGHYGARGWYCWASFIWSWPHKRIPVVNPWLNSWTPWNNGLVSFFYPPDPHGPVVQPTDKIIPSYRLYLMRDGIEEFALFEVLEQGRDDAGDAVNVDQDELSAARKKLEKLWINPTQWYISYDAYYKAKRSLYNAMKN